MATTSLALKVALGLLMVDAMIEMAFISSMVAWLHRRAGRSFEIEFNDSSYSLHGKPVGVLANQGHTSNGASGTAFVLIGLGGILALWLRSRQNFHSSTASKIMYHFWLFMTVPAALLSGAALIYTFLITLNHRGQSIDQAVASSLNNQPYPNYVAYPLDMWTPENWFAAILKLDLVHEADRHNISMHLTVMKAWRWNLIPLFVLGLAVSALAFVDALANRRRMHGRSREYSPDSKRVSI